MTDKSKPDTLKKTPLIVQKYGGSSLATPEHIKAVAEKIAALRRAGSSAIIVVSAMGKTTDQLVELAYKVSAGPNRREFDMLLSTGERISMALVSMALNEVKCAAISFTGSQAGVLTDQSHSNARILDIKPIRVEAEVARGNVVVLAGFQGVCPKTKEVTTLGRGGSDVTAVAMAAYFGAERCEIRKDVDGVYSADPQAVNGARHLPRLHFMQLLDMTYWGAKVLHYRSVELANLLNIPLLVALSHGDGGDVGKNTRIDGEATMYEQARVLSVNSHKDVRWLSVEKTDLKEAFQELHSALRDNNLPWPQLLDTQKRNGAWAYLVTGPSETLNAIGHLSHRYAGLTLENTEFSSVTATCQGSFATNLPEEIAAALAKKSIVIHKMLFSAMSVTVLVDARERDRAVEAVHALL